MTANGSGLAAVIEKELKAKLIQMIYKINVAEKLHNAERLLLAIDALIEGHSDTGLVFKSQQHCHQAVFHIRQLALLLSSESENSGKNDADNSGKPM